MGGIHEHPVVCGVLMGFPQSSVCPHGALECPEGPYRAVGGSIGLWDTQKDAGCGVFIGSPCAHAVSRVTHPAPTGAGPAELPAACAVPAPRGRGGAAADWSAPEGGRRRSGPRPRSLWPWRTAKMAAPMEVALVSDAAGPLCNCSVWELHSGSALPGYRGGNSGPRGLALLGGEHLLGAQLGKSYINVWELQRKVPARRAGPGGLGSGSAPGPRGGTAGPVGDATGPSFLRTSRPWDEEPLRPQSPPKSMARPPHGLSPHKDPPWPLSSWRSPLCSDTPSWPSSLQRPPWPLSPQRPPPSPVRPSGPPFISFRPPSPRAGAPHPSLRRDPHRAPPEPPCRGALLAAPFPL